MKENEKYRKRTRKIKRMTNEEEKKDEKNEKYRKRTRKIKIITNEEEKRDERKWKI